MAGNNFQVSGDNLPKDSGNRYFQAPYDPVNNAFALQWAYPVSGSAAGTVIGHGVNHVVDSITSTGGISSGVDLGGWTVKGLLVPIMGSACNVFFQVSGSAFGWVNLNDSATNGVTFTGYAGTYALHQTTMQHVTPYRWIRLSASQPQTALRIFTWVLNT